LHYGWRRRYVIVIGEPIIVTRMENATKEDRDELSARVMDAIRSQIDTAKLALAA
jgi:hypothetical protein